MEQENDASKLSYSLWTMTQARNSQHRYVEYELSLASLYQYLLCIPPQEPNIHVLIGVVGCSSSSNILEVTLYHDILI